MGKRSKQKKGSRQAKARPSSDKADGPAGKPWDRPTRTPLHSGFTGRQAGRPQTNLRQGRGR